MNVALVSAFSRNHNSSCPCKLENGPIRVIQMHRWGVCGFAVRRSTAKRILRGDNIFVVMPLKRTLNDLIRGCKYETRSVCLSVAEQPFFKSQQINVPLAALTYAAGVNILRDFVVKSNSMFESLKET